MKEINGYAEHMKLFYKSCADWRKDNYKEPSVRKSMRYIATQKKKHGVL